MGLTPHWRYLKAVLRHKRFVFEEGRQLGLGVWQLLIHDWQKFTPTEWFPYANAFYGAKGRKTGKPEGDSAFDRAWLHHQKCGPHHWQYWLRLDGLGHGLRVIDLGILVEDSGRILWLNTGEPVKDPDILSWIYPLPMPDRYRREMLADWRGANRAYGDIPLIRWYQKTKGARRLHPLTLAWVERQLGIRRS